MKKYKRLAIGIMGAWLVLGSALPGWAALRKGAKAPKFTLETVNGEENDVSLSGLLKKNKVVFVNIFNTWCGPCIKETPGMVKVYEEYKEKGVEFVSVCTSWRRDTAKKAARFAKRFDISWPMLFDADGSVTKAYQVRGVPTNCVVTADGRITFYKAGGLREKAFRAILDDALDQAAPAEAREDEEDEDGDGDTRILPRKGMAYLGVRLDDPLPFRYDDEAPAGVEVIEIVEDSPAEEGGLEEGDIIQKANGKKIRSIQQMVTWVRRHDPGDTMKLTILRDGRKKSVSIKLGSKKRRRTQN